MKKEDLKQLIEDEPSFKDARKDKIEELRGINWSWGAIGTYFGLTRARVHQIGSGYHAKNVNSYRTIVLERDDYTCNVCNKKFDISDLIIHHKDGDDRNNNEDNLETKCRSCHATHHLKGMVYSSTEMVNVRCKNCKLDFTRREEEERNNPSPFCSKECHVDYYNKKWTMVCNGCGKKFIVKEVTRGNYYHNHSKFEKKSYCSRECFTIHVKKYGLPIDN